MNYDPNLKSTSPKTSTRKGKIYILRVFLVLLEMLLDDCFGAPPLIYIGVSHPLLNGNLKLPPLESTWRTNGELPHRRGKSVGPMGWPADQGGWPAMGRPHQPLLFCVVAGQWALLSLDADMVCFKLVCLSGGPSNPCNAHVAASDWMASCS